MGELFGSSRQASPPPPLPVLATPTPMPVPDPEEQKRAATKRLEQKAAQATTRRSTIIGDDDESLG